MGLTEDEWAMIQANISRAKLASVGRQLAQDAQKPPQEPVGRVNGQSKPSKHRNRKVAYEGLVFDSEKECRRWQELVLLERVGAIRNLQRQVDFDLWACNGERIARYRADFVYDSLELGRTVIEDTKSPHSRTLRDYRLKFKLMRAQGQTITEV
jgi:hypothetical protein